MRHKFLELCLMKKKKEERRKKNKNNKIQFFAFDFLDWEERSWDSGAIFYIRIAKGLHP